MITKRLKVLALVVLLATVGLLVGACSSDENSTPVGPSPLRYQPGGSSLFPRSTSSIDSVGVDDNSSDDNSDDNSSDDSSSDDSSDDNGDDDSNVEEKVRGLFFGLVDQCPVTEPPCVLALTIKDTLVVVTAETEVEIEPMPDGAEHVEPSDLFALLSTESALGLMMTAEGVVADGVLVVSELTIEDNVRAQGEVAVKPGCDLAIIVKGVTMCFGLDEEITPPAAGTAVRVEGEVSYDSALNEFSFEAERVERID